MHYETPEDVLRACIDRLRGPKVVGVLLRPELEERPETAGRWLSDCLNDEKREKLSLHQVLFILRRARDAGFHDGMNAWNHLAGYGPSTPLTPEHELADLARQMVATQERFSELSTEVHARMQAAGLKLDAAA